jgi:hypothetical protein
MYSKFDVTGIFCLHSIFFIKEVNTAFAAAHCRSMVRAAAAGAPAPHCHSLLCSLAEGPV